MHKKNHGSTYRYLQILQEDETKNWLVVSNIFPECVAKGSRSFCCAHVAVSMGSCKTSVSACPLASPRLWGKLQNLVRFAPRTSPCLRGKLQNLSLCLSSGIAVSMEKLQNLACLAALTSPCL